MSTWCFFLNSGPVNMEAQFRAWPLGWFVDEQFLDCKPALGKGSRRAHKRKGEEKWGDEEMGGEGRRKEKAFNCIVKVK